MGAESCPRRCVDRYSRVKAESVIVKTASGCLTCYLQLLALCLLGEVSVEEGEEVGHLGVEGLFRSRSGREKGEVVSFRVRPKVDQKMGNLVRSHVATTTSREVRPKRGIPTDCGAF